MKKTHPKLCICGTADGYFRDEAPVIARINEARADVVFVCLGAPKQECFMHDHRAELNVRLMIGLGAVWTLCRDGAPCAEVDDPPAAGVALSPAARAEPHRAHDAPAEIRVRRMAGSRKEGVNDGKADRF